MAAPMRSSSQDAGHRARVADSRSTTAKPDTQATNFEYDDNEWDIGIGDLIIDLDADIEKTNEGAAGPGTNTAVMATNASPAGSTKTAAKMAIEHSATVDKGLKMKIKRTKPGTKTSEAKHEIVKSNEQNGNADGAEVKAAAIKHPTPNAEKKYGCVNNTPTGGATTNSTTNSTPNNNNINNNNNNNNGKRGSSGHRRDKARDKHGTDKPAAAVAATATAASAAAAAAKVASAASPVTVTEMNGIVRVSAPQPGLQRPVFPASTGPGPPPSVVPTAPPPGPPPSPAAATAQGSAAKPEQAKGNTAAVGGGCVLQPLQPLEESSSSPPPTKKMKSEPKDVTDVCVGTSVGTITEPDCLGPCEPGTSVTLEGIVWHETEGGVLVVNVTWRGKTYVGTLLDCTRHDWAPPRFCDSPTSDLDTRTPKGRETRSSVHSKLRNGGIKGRRGATNGPGPSTAPSSPTPFVPPRSTEPGNKRKVRAGEEEPQPNVPAGKKTKVITPVSNAATTTTCGSPPPSPVLLECPEPNCSKKYKHINGLKYHQSHAHGSVDDDDTKDVTSMSENDESNIEAPSPATPVKSPEKSQDSPAPVKKDVEIPLLLRGAGLLDVPSNSQPGTPVSTPPSPATPQSLQDMVPTAGSPTVPLVESKNVVKPGILRFGNTEEFPMGVFTGSKSHVTGGSNLPNSNLSSRSVTVSVSPEPAPPQPEPNIQPQSFTNQLQTQIPQQFTQPPTLLIPTQNAQNPPSQMSPILSQSPTQLKMTQFKVKPAAALMPDDKKDRNSKVGSFKKKNRKSPAGSPHPPQNEPPMFGMEQSGRDEVLSPAYSDISDDGAPVLDADLENKKSADKKTEQPLPHMPQYGIYPFYGQSPYLVPSSQENKPKEPEKVAEKPVEKEAKKDGEYPPKMMQHYMPFGYMSGYAYNLDYGSSVPMVADDKIIKEERKENPSPNTEHSVKPITPIPNPIQVPTPGKIKSESGMKEKHQNDNHQILKESIEMKSQMNSYMYSRQQQQQQQQQSQQHHQHVSRDEDVRRFYVYSDQRRKEQEHKTGSSNKAPPPQSPNVKHKEKLEDKKEKDVKQEGVKPTMETQGPPPPPTSQYAYIHPTYMQSPHYGPLAFDPNHPMYRGIMVPGPYSGNPYLHPQLPRYHAPEDLSRAPPPTKALDMLQHHAQYYSSHKIHELQERALKSPTPKTSIASSSPSANAGAPGGQVVAQMGGQAASQPSNSAPAGGKQTPGDNKDSRSPPPQRHVHTHHHTHVGLGYPMYPAPYGAAVLASQQAAAVTVINPYPPK